LSNSLFVIVVDVSQSESERQRQLHYWLDFVMSCVKPTTVQPTSTNTVSMIIVGSQCDKLMTSTTSPTTNKTAMRECLSQLNHIATQWQRNQDTYTNCIDIKSIVVSSVTNLNVDQLIHIITTASHTLINNSTSSMVPPKYVLAQQTLDSTLPSTSTSTSKHTTPQTVRIAHALTTMRDLIDSNLIFGFDASMAEYLHSIGEIVVSPCNTLVCLDPQLLSRLMSLFVCSNDHYTRINNSLAVSCNNATQASITAMHSVDRSTIDIQHCKALIRTMLDHQQYLHIGM
jgi:hypothetical protein